MKLLNWGFPAFILLVCMAWVGSAARAPKPRADGIDYAALGQIPVRTGGRVMPIATLAQNNLLAISERTEVLGKDDKHPVVASAVEWFVDSYDAGDWIKGPAGKHCVFRIDNDQLLSMLELPRRVGFYRYSLTEISNGKGLERINSEMKRVTKKKNQKKSLDLLDSKIEDLWGKLGLYQRMCEGESIQAIPPDDQNAEWKSFNDLTGSIASSLTTTEREKLFDASQLRMFEELQKKYGEDPKNIPEDERERIPDMMKFYFLKEIESASPLYRSRVSPAAAALTELLTAARVKDAERFNKAFADYQPYLDNVPAKDRNLAKLESVFLARIQPFYYCAFLYLFVLLLASFGWMGLRKPFHRAALWLALFALLFHTSALVIRMVINGRPPVTNLYSSAVFIGWGAVGLSIILEAIYRNGIGSFVAGVAGGATLILAKFLGGSGDTMSVLQAVLDTNFWLATHVTCVTLGYTATLVAGIVALLYILYGLFTPKLNAEYEKAFARIMYGVTCFATLLSFVGTVLGGIWGDYSWGRFWGWDPKENGAVLIVIWNCLILHARWGGIVKARGMALLLIFGNCITAWSWFGTNQLQLGLHSYGFSSELAEGCRYFWISQIAIIALGCIPKALWLSSWYNEKEEM